MEKPHLLLKRRRMMQFQILQRTQKKLPRIKQTELSQLLKKIKLEEVTGSCSFKVWLLFKILFMDLTKSRSLIFLCPNSLDTAALFSFCLHTIHSLQLIKLKKPEKKVGNKVNKVLCLRGNKKKTILFKNQKNLLEITKLKAELLSKKLKDNTEEIS